MSEMVSDSIARGHDGKKWEMRSSPMVDSLILSHADGESRASKGEKGSEGEKKQDANQLPRPGIIVREVEERKASGKVAEGDAFSICPLQVAA